MANMFSSRNFLHIPSQLVQIIFRWPLWLAAGLSLAGYWLARFWFPLRPFFNQLPLSDIRTFTPSWEHGILYAVWLGMLYGLYWLAYRRVRQQGAPLWVILGTAVLLAIPLLKTYPINANDVYRYVIRGRITSVYDENPFVVPPTAIEDDPFLPFAGEWAGAASPYGPVWELTAAAVTAVTGDNLFLGLTAFKLLGLAAHLAVAVLIWQALADMPQNIRAGRTLLWAWNPALLLMFVVDGHNDALMLFWLLLGWLLAQRGRPLPGLLLALLAPLTKPIGLLPLPFFFLALWQKMPDGRARRRFLLRSVAGGAILGGLAFLPFGSPLDLLLRLQNEASGGVSFSFAALVLLAARLTGVLITQTLLQKTAVFSVALLAVVGCLLLWRKRPFLRSAADIFAAYILTALNFRLWYTTWLFPWLLLDVEQEPRDTPREGENDHSLFSIHPSAFRLHTGLWLLLTTQLSVLIYGHLRVYLLGGDYFLAHLIGVPFVFLLPLILAKKQ